MKKGILITVLALIIIFGGLFYWKYYFVFGEGVKSGYLNFAVRKGQVFKTYEGKLIQEGLARSRSGTGVQSNEFEFSIENKEIYDSLSVNAGKIFDLHYKEYNGALPWRGNTKYIVDSIISLK